MQEFWPPSTLLLAVLAVAIVIGAVVFAVRRAHARLLRIGIEQAAIGIEKAIAVVRDPAPHDFAVLSDHRYEGEAGAFVDDKTQALLALGFRVLGDIEDRTVSAAVGVPAIIRAFVHDDSAIIGIVFVRPGAQTQSGEPGPLVKMVEFSNEHPDERFTETIAGDETPILDAGPRISVLRLPPTTSPQALLEAHLGRRGVDCVRVGDLDGAIQQAHRGGCPPGHPRRHHPGGAQHAQRGHRRGDHQPSLRRAPAPRRDARLASEREVPSAVRASARPSGTSGRLRPPSARRSRTTAGPSRMTAQRASLAAFFSSRACWPSRE